LNAPLEKLDKTTERIVKELKEANSEKKKLLKELAANESGVLAESSAETEEISGVKLVKRDFGEETDVNRMVQTASEILKRNGASVMLFYGADLKTAQIMVMAGEEAVAKGLNAGEIVKLVAPLLGGGGGGRANFAQGGGAKPEKIAEAIRAAEEALKKQLKK